MYNVISLYKYAKIKNPEKSRDEFRIVCKKLRILGRILISEEGINAAVCGEEKQIETFKKFLLKRFPKLTFREQKDSKNVYHKLVVRVRNEVVVFGEKVDLRKKGKLITPKNLKKQLDAKEKIILLDARNHYEYKVGKFDNAIDLGIRTFKDFPKKIKKIEPFKSKKIVMYCTGGIRCEKASAFLKQKGFKKVYHLKGGIINYLNEFSEGENHFKGGCFVFDDRLVSKTGKPLSACKVCKELTEEIINCNNLDCDKLFICCEKCQKKRRKYCSEKCKNSLRQRKPKQISVIDVGIIENYYPRAKVALAKIEKELEVGQKIIIQGKTTKIQEKIKEMRDYDGNKIEKAKFGERVTFPVSKKVRKNDVVMVEDKKR